MESDTKVNRREFLCTGITNGAGLVALSGISILPQRVWGANDRVRMAVVGVRGQGGEHLKGFGKVPDTEVAAICDIDDSVISKRLADMAELEHAQAASLQRRSQAPGRQIHRRDFHCHAQPLAFLDGHLGVPGGQGRLCREALLALLVGRPPTGCRRAQIRSHRHARNAGPLRRRLYRGRAQASRRA